MSGSRVAALVSANSRRPSESLFGFLGTACAGLASLAQVDSSLVRRADIPLQSASQACQGSLSLGPGYSSGTYYLYKDEVLGADRIGGVSASMLSKDPKGFLSIKT